MSDVPHCDCNFFIAVIIVGLFALFMLLPSASAEVLYEGQFKMDHTEDRVYQIVFPEYSNGTFMPEKLYIADIEDLTQPYKLACVYDASFFTPAEDIFGNPKTNYFVEDEICTDGVKTEVIGNITHGYTYESGGAKVCYQMHFHDINLEGLSGDTTLYYDALEGQAGFGYTLHNCYLASYLFDALESAEPVFGGPSASRLGVLGQDDELNGDPDHKYYLERNVNFKNKYYVQDYFGVYEFIIQRENIVGWEGETKSRYKIWSSDYLYSDQVNCSDLNESLIMGSEVCDWLYIECWDEEDTYFFANITGFCQEAEPGYFDLSGYTRSIYGNLVPSVKLEAKGETEYSDNTSFYEFENLETSSFVLAWNKTGYHNDNMPFYIGYPGEYVHDVYLIPLDALDEGEFGGVIYDYCTLEPIQGAYVYLFNETLNSGKYVYSNKYGFYRFAGLTEGLEYQVSASKEGYIESIVHSFTFNETNINETFCKTKNLLLLPEGGCPEDEDGGGGIPTASPSPTPTPHEWSNEEIVSWLRTNLMTFFILIFLFTFLWFIRRAGGSKR